MAFRRFATLIFVRPIHVLVNGSGKNARFHVREIFSAANCQCVCAMPIGGTTNVDQRVNGMVTHSLDRFDLKEGFQFL